MRTERTPADLERVADEIAEAGVILKEIARQMRQHQVATIFTHGKTQVLRHIPMLLDWVYKVEAESKSQIRDRDKRRSTAEKSNRDGELDRTNSLRRQNCNNGAASGMAIAELAALASPLTQRR